MPWFRQTVRPVDVKLLAERFRSLPAVHKELELLLFDKRVQYNDLNRVPFGSSYFCHRVLPKQIIFENLTVEKKLSRMHNDMDEIVKSLTKCRDKIEWKKK